MGKTGIKTTAVIANAFFYLHLSAFLVSFYLNHFDPFNSPIDITIRGKVSVIPEIHRPELIQGIENFNELSVLIEKSAFMRFDYTSYRDSITINNLGYFLIDNLVKLLWLFITFQTRNILRSLGKHKVFDPKNFERLRWISVIIFLIPIGQWLAYRIFVLIVRAETYIEGYRFDIYQGIDVRMFGIAFLILTIGEVFRQGIKLQEQADLTI